MKNNLENLQKIIVSTRTTRLTLHRFEAPSLFSPGRGKSSTGASMVDFRDICEQFYMFFVGFKASVDSITILSDDLCFIPIIKEKGC